jgi:VanZ family protein
MKQIFFIILSITWMYLIYFLSSLPSSATGPDTLTFKIISHLLHLVMFGILSILFLFTLKWNNPLSETRPFVFILSLLLTIIYAITDEYHQSFSPGRFASIKDILIDASGAIISLFTIYYVKRKQLIHYGKTLNY